MSYERIMEELKSLSDPKNVEGMARFGVSPDKTFGISIPNLRRIAKETGKSHYIALRLWASGFHEARILAGMVDDPNSVSEAQMDEWIKDFDSWDVCDQVCMNLFDKLPLAFEKAKEWSEREEEFEKRAGFALMACLAWHNKESEDSEFEKFFPSIKKHSTDERNFVKKAVNWALRQIGKRNPVLNKKAIETAKEIQKIDSKAAKWIANDALRELTSEKMQERLKNKK